MQFDKSLFKEKVGTIQKKYSSTLQQHAVTVDNLFDLILEDEKPVLRYIPHPAIGNEIKKEIIRAFDNSHLIRTA